MILGDVINMSAWVTDAGTFWADEEEEKVMQEDVTAFAKTSVE